MKPVNLWLSRYAKFVVASTLCLIFLGAMVTSKGAGLSVPDWPTSFHYNMFTFPVSLWKGPIVWEHTHRLLASAIGFFTIILAVWIWQTDDRRWVKGLGVGALVLVIIQGILGGLRVTEKSLTLAMVHGCTAQAFLCVLTLLALALSNVWDIGVGSGVASASLRRWSWGLVVVVYIQLIIGAVMRHLGAGLAIWTFPLVFGQLVPPVHNTLIDIHYAHRVWALVVTVVAMILVTKVFVSAKREGLLLRPAMLICGLLLVQVILGASIILLAAPSIENAQAVLPQSVLFVKTLHVVNGAALLATCFTLAVRATRLSANEYTQAAGFSDAHATA